MDALRERPSRDRDEHAAPNSIRHRGVRHRVLWLQSSTDCDCGPTGLTITIPPDRIQDVDRVTTIGACAVEADTGTTPAAGTIHIEASAEGTCHVEITFLSGAPAYATDVAFTYILGDCCLGYYAERDRTIVNPFPSERLSQ